MRLQNFGYAVSAHRAQGRTVDTAHAIADGTLTRGTLYVAMTRGKESNRVYVAVDGFEEDTLDPKSHLEILQDILHNTGQNQSAHESVSAELDRLTSAKQLALEHESILADLDEQIAPTLLDGLGLDVEAMRKSRAWPRLADTLRQQAETDQAGLIERLQGIVHSRGWGDVEDPTAVLTHRLQQADVRPQEPRSSDASPQSARAS